MKIKFRPFRINSSFLQYAGLVLITLGIGFLLFRLLERLFIDSPSPLTGSEIAIIFFITMLGISFVFPDMLKGRTKEVSTMRIVVFMMVNVICMLLLKLGWGQPDLRAIGLDQYWVGVIAFVFGAKATQSYFESKLAVPPANKTASTLSQPELAKLAISQNEEVLRVKFPNIASLSDVVHDLNGTVTHVVAIYLKDNNTVGLPARLEVISNGSTQYVDTEVIRNVGTGSIQISQQTDNVCDSGSVAYTGSVCCLVKSTTDPAFLGLVTSGHIYSNGSYLNCNGVLSQAQQGLSVVNSINAGPWYLQIINNFQDIAVAHITSLPTPQAGYTPINEYYEVTDKDVITPQQNVTLISKNHRVDAYIIDYNVAFEIDYKGGVNRRMNNIVLIGTDRVRDNSKPVSVPGDSGCCIIEKASGHLIGLLLGGNDKYSFVLPVKNTLESFNLKPL